MIPSSDLMAFVRRRSGTVAAASAIAGFAIGAVGAYQVLHAPPAPPILLRQATEGDPMATFDETPGAGGMLVLLRNDGTSPVLVMDAAFARTSAAPPLYIAPETVQPGAEVNVYVPVPGTCFAGIAPGTSAAVVVAGSTTAPPVQILVSARLPDGPTESIPVEVVGELAAIMDACHNQGASASPDAHIHAGPNH
jgi:hypothetical protein